MKSWTKKNEAKFFSYLTLDLLVYFLFYLYIDQIINNGRSPLFLISWIWKKNDRSNINDNTNSLKEEAADIDIAGLKKEFRKKTIVQDFTLQIKEGEIVCLLG